MFYVDIYVPQFVKLMKSDEISHHWPTWQMKTPENETNCYCNAFNQRLKCRGFPPSSENEISPLGRVIF